MPRKLFSDLLSNSRYINSPNFSLRYRLAGNDVRVGVSVSKKVSKSAVKRNSVRRRAYSSLSNTIKTLPKGLYLVVAKNGAVTLRGESLVSELENLLKQATIL